MNSWAVAALHSCPVFILLCRPVVETGLPLSSWNEALCKTSIPTLILNTVCRLCPPSVPARCSSVFIFHFFCAFSFFIFCLCFPPSFFFFFSPSQLSPPTCLLISSLFSYSFLLGCFQFYGVDCVWILTSTLRNPRRLNVICKIRSTWFGFVCLQHRQWLWRSLVCVSEQTYCAVHQKTEDHQQVPHEEVSQIFTECTFDIFDEHFYI